MKALREANANLLVADFGSEPHHLHQFQDEGVNALGLG